MIENAAIVFGECRISLRLFLLLSESLDAEKYFSFVAHQK